MKFIMGMIVFAGVSQASAASLQINPGLYVSEKCKVEVFQQKSGNLYIELDTVASPQTTLRGDHLTITPSGKVVDGPGLCTDEQTLGKGAAAKVVTSLGQIDGANVLKVNCGGKFKAYQLALEMVVDAKGDLVSFVASSRAGLRKQSVICLDFEKVQ